MSKSVQRIIILLLVGLVLGIYAVFQILRGPDSDHVFLGIAYLVPSVAAFVAVIKLPTRPAE